MGLKIFLLVIGVALILSGFLLGGSIWENIRVEANGIKQKSGVLLADPLLMKDEYNQDTVSIRFFVLGDENVLVVPGQHLRTLDKRIFNLQEGDEIKYWVRKKPSIIPMQNDIQNLFGLEDKEGMIIKPQEAFEYYGQINYYLVMVLFVLFGAAAYVFLQLSKMSS